jgi:hypothetical protein
VASPANDVTASKTAQLATLYTKLYEAYFLQTSPVEFGLYCTAASKLIGKIVVPWSDAIGFKPAEPHTIKWHNLPEERCIELFRENVVQMMRGRIDDDASYNLKMAFHLFSEEQRVEVSSNYHRSFDGIPPVDFYLEIQPLVPERWKANLLQTALISWFVQKGNHPLAVERFREVFESLKEGEVFFLQGCSNRHTRIYAIKKDVSDSYELAIIDTGAGCTMVGLEDVALIYQGLRQQQLFDSKMLDLLIKKHGGFWAANPFPEINQAIQKLLGQKPIHRSIIGQNYGTCVASSLMEAFSLYASQEEYEILKKRFLNYTVVQVARAQLQLTALGRHVRESEEGMRLKQDVRYLRSATKHYVPISERSVDLPQRLKIKFQTLVLELMNLVDSVEDDPKLEKRIKEALKSQDEQEDQSGHEQFHHFTRLVEQGHEYTEAFARGNHPQAQSILRWGKELCKLMSRALENQEGEPFESMEREVRQSKINIAKARVVLEEYWATQGIEVPLQRRVSADRSAILEGGFNTFGGFGRGRALLDDGSIWEGAFDPTLHTVTLRHGKMWHPDGSVRAGHFRENKLFNGTGTHGDECYEVRNGNVVASNIGGSRRRQRGV